MIVFFGPAGSGKSTQGQIIAEKYDCVWLSVGQLLREQEQSHPELSKQLAAGELVDDQLVVEMMAEAIQRTDGKRVILDGYPRDKWQAEWLVAHQGLREVRGVIVLDGDREQLVERLIKRGREDDTEEVVRGRFGLFDRTMGEILPVLTGAGIVLAQLDCIGTIEEVTERIESQLVVWGIV
jgi:adenylate kinase